MSDAKPEIEINIVQILSVAAGKLQTRFLTDLHHDRNRCDRRRFHLGWHDAGKQFQQVRVRLSAAPNQY